MIDNIYIIINSYEKQIHNAKSKREIKTIVRKMFEDSRVDDIDFSDLIYQDIIPKLEELGVVFDRENDIDYEIVLKEEY